MITLTKLNDVTFVLNCDLIETIAANPDTTIHLTNGNLYIVKEKVEEVVAKTVEYRRKIYRNIMDVNQCVEQEQETD